MFTRPVVGWRLWKVDPKARELRSTFMAHSWPIDTAEAKHLGHVGPMAMGFVPPGGKVLAASLREAAGCEPPQPGHRCGFNAFDTLEDAYHQNKSPINRWDFAHVFGAIAGEGRVILHERGFRSSKARVLCLVEDPPDNFFPPQDGKPVMDAVVWAERMAEVAGVYDVPILPSDLAQHYVRDEGLSVEDYLATR